MYCSPIRIPPASLFTCLASTWILGGCGPVTVTGSGNSAVPNVISASVLAKLKIAGIVPSFDLLYPLPKGDPNDAASYLPTLATLERTDGQSRPYFAVAEKVALCKVWHPQHEPLSASNVDDPDKLEENSHFHTLQGAETAFKDRATIRAKDGDLSGAITDLNRVILLVHLSGSELTYLGPMGEVNDYPSETIAHLLPLFAKNPQATNELFAMMKTTPKIDYPAFVRRIASESLAKGILRQHEIDAAPHDDDWDGGPMTPSLDEQARQWLEFLKLLKGDPHDPLEMVKASAQWERHFAARRSDDLIYWPLAYDTAEFDIERTELSEMLRVAATAQQAHSFPVPPKGGPMVVEQTTNGWRLRFPTRPNVADGYTNTLGYPRITFDGKSLEIMCGE
jgi:hypothetical protein